MASIPFRKRGKMAKAARTARNLAIADAALALAGDRFGGSRKRRPSGRLLLIGGAAAAVAAGALWKRDKVAGLLPSGGGDEPYQPHAPGPSNYDAPGPVANTATPVPAPDPQEPAAIDEAAEEEAAAAEAANIGGPVSDYAGPADLPADEAERPLAEAGEGEAEGQEQAERDLLRAAEPTAPGMSDTERQIEDTIEAAENPATGETVEPVTPADDSDARVEDDETAAAGDESSGTGPSERGDEASGTGPSEPGDESSGSDWQTWSGRSVNP
jgi:hypothetical protein